MENEELDRLSPTGLADENEDVDEMSYGDRMAAERAMDVRDGRQDDLLYGQEESSEAAAGDALRRRREAAADFIEPEEVPAINFFIIELYFSS